MSPRPRAAHHAMNCPTARPYAARVRRFAIRAATNASNLATATGPASTISGGTTSRARRRPVDARLERLVVVRQRLGERDEPSDGVLRGARPGQPGPGPAGADGRQQGAGAARRDAAAPVAIAAGAAGAGAGVELADGVGDGEQPAGRGGHRGSAVSATTPAARASWEDVWRAAPATGD